jgi:hypothetical protein
MALRKATPAETAEAVGNVAVAEAAPLINQPDIFETEDAPAETVASAETIAVAKASASTAIAKAQSTAIATANPIKGAYAELRNVIPIEDVEGLGIGAFPRVTVDLGGFLLDKTEIGTEIVLELLSWNFRYMVTTGADDEEAKKKVKVSYDGHTVANTGESIAEAIEAFKEEGYEDAESKTYIDLWGSLCTKGGVALAEAERPIVQVQLSPESVKKFKAFQVEVGFKQARGLIGATPTITITIKSQRGEWKNNRFGFCTFSLK